MLRFRAFGEELPFLSRFAGAGLFLLEALEIEHEKEEANDAANPVCNERVHDGSLEVPQKELQSDVDHREHSKGIAERLVHHVPQMEDFLRA